MATMNYALIKNGLVDNIIWLHPMNASDFPGAVALDGIPAAIGDEYDGEHFYRDGEVVLIPAERENAEKADMEAALALLGIDGGVE